jgi:hypothetical protein
LDAERGLAHYLWPPKWIGAEPEWVDHGPVPQSPVELADVIVEADLVHGIRARAFRDGMIAFALGPEGAAYETDFEAWEQSLVRLMNAHLACLQSTVPEPGLLWCSVVTVWSSMQVKFPAGTVTGASTGSAGLVALELYNARTVLSAPYDWRLFRGPLRAIPADAVEESFGMLSRLLDLPHKIGEADLLERPALFRAELLQRAKSALLDMDTTGALTNAWTASEGMLGDMLNRYLDETKDRPAGHDAHGNKLAFMTSKRRGFFGSGLWTIRHTMEFLSLVDRLPFDLYREAHECSQARNNWMHYEKVPSPKVADMAIRVAGKLFELLEGVPLRMHGRPIKPGSPDQPSL